MIIEAADSYETPRLLIKMLTMDDLEGFALLKADNRVTSAYFAAPKTKKESQEKLKQLLLDISQGKSYSCSVFEKAEGQWIGTLVLWNLLPEQKTGEVGYEFLPQYWGKGYAKEAIPAFINYVHEKYGYLTFTACPSVTNPASNKALMASGFLFDREFEDNGHRFRNYIYQLNNV